MAAAPVTALGLYWLPALGSPAGSAPDGEGETLPWLDRAQRNWELHEAEAAGVAM